MAREKIGDDVMQVRFPDGTFARIDAISENRSEWIREIVLGALNAWEDDVGSAAPVTVEQAMEPNAILEDLPMKAVDGDGHRYEPKTSLPGLKPDAEVLLAAIRKKRLTSRDAEKSMGWLGLRYSKAEKQLIQAGLARIEDGVLVAEGEGC